MAQSNMLTLSLHLDAQPGSIIPELHLKEGCTSVEVNLLIKDRTLLPNATSKDFYIRGVLPDGTELFRRGFTTYNDVYVLGQMRVGDIKLMAKVPGRYQCTITIANTQKHPTRQQLMNYDFVTVLPFTVVVHPKARRDEDA